MTTFHLRSRADKLGMCKNHSMLVRNDFLLFDFELHSEKIHSLPNAVQILKIVHSGLFRLHSVSV